MIFPFTLSQITRTLCDSSRIAYTTQGARDVAVERYNAAQSLIELHRMYIMSITLMTVKALACRAHRHRIDARF
jgi:hypothetical protein